MHEEKKETDKESIGYKAGTAIGLTVSVCVIVLMVVATVKLGRWIWML